MKIELTLNETRVLGCLMEKSVTTPDQHPLTLNSLTNACNQKSSRNPILTLDGGIVQRTARQLEERHLLSREENFNTRVEKYSQRFCNTPFAEYQFSDAEFALVCVLLLRGPQTPGELRTRSARLHHFEHNGEVSEVLQGMIDREDGPLVVPLPRTAGRKDSEYAHLFSGEVEPAPIMEPPQAVPAPLTRSSSESRLEARVASLEEAVRELREAVQELQRNHPSIPDHSSQ